jgi:hypothetical protein
LALSTEYNDTIVRKGDIVNQFVLKAFIIGIFDVTKTVLTVVSVLCSGESKVL